MNTELINKVALGIGFGIGYGFMATVGVIKLIDIIKTVSDFGAFLLESYLKKHNIIPIIDNHISKHINMEVYEYFTKMYNTLDKSKDINIIINTFGGHLSAAECIVNTLIYHKSKYPNSKVKVYIPSYCCSAGLFISLFCDEIILLPTSSVSPCDGQMSVGFLNYSSASSIMKTFNYKQDNKEKIDESWLSKAFDAESLIKRQQKYVDKLKEINKYDDNVCEQIYKSFFSGENNHDQIFNYKELQDIGLNITVVDEMNDIVKYVFKVCKVNK